MCLDHGSFLLVQGEEETSLENVACLFSAGTHLKIVDVFGKTREIVGSVSEIDLLNRRIVLA